MVNNDIAQVSAVMQQINQAWLEGRVEDMAEWIHPEIIMIFPGFQGQSRGRDEFLAGFHEFTNSATTHEFHEVERQVDAVGDTAVVTFRYEMVYEMSGERYRATGRDMWVFHRQDEAWIAVWRAMFDTDEQVA